MNKVFLFYLIIVGVLLIYDSLGDFGVVNELMILKENHRLKTSLLVFPILFLFCLTHHIINDQKRE